MYYTYPMYYLPKCIILPKMYYTKGNVLYSSGVFPVPLSGSHVGGFGVQKGMPVFEGDSLPFREPGVDRTASVSPGT